MDVIDNGVIRGGIVGSSFTAHFSSIPNFRDCRVSFNVTMFGGNLAALEHGSTKSDLADFSGAERTYGENLLDVYDT